MGRNLLLIIGKVSTIILEEIKQYIKKKKPMNRLSGMFFYNYYLFSSLYLISLSTTTAAFSSLLLSHIFSIAFKTKLQPPNIIFIIRNLFWIKVIPLNHSPWCAQPKAVLGAFPLKIENLNCKLGFSFFYFLWATDHSKKRQKVWCSFSFSDSFQNCPSALPSCYTLVFLLSAALFQIIATPAVTWTLRYI